MASRPCPVIPRHSCCLALRAGILVCVLWYSLPRMTTQVIEANLLKSLPKPERVLRPDPGTLPVLTSKMNLFADLVENNWPDLPITLQALAKKYAYLYLERKRPRSIQERIRFAIFMFRNISALDDFAKLHAAVTRFTEAVFSKIEYDDSSYRQHVIDAIDSSGKATATTVDELRDWLQHI